MTSPPRVAFTAVRCVNHGQLFRNRIMEGLSTTLERADLARLGVVPGERVLMSSLTYRRFWKLGITLLEAQNRSLVTNRRLL